MAKSPARVKPDFLQSAQNNGAAKSAVDKQPAVVQKTLNILWNDLPHWMKDNHYIHTGYRAPSNSYRGSAASIWRLHNESMNIWTHLVGSILALITGSILLLSFYGGAGENILGYDLHNLVGLKSRYKLATYEDVLVFACFFGGATVCLGMSATYHTISNHSEKVARFGNRLDYLGIVVLIWGSFVPSIFYGFAQEKVLMRRYWGMITTIGAGTLVVVLYPKFRSPEWRPVRAAMFVAMGLSAIFPVLHGIQLFGIERLEQQIGLSWLVLQGVLYVVGAGIYAARVPERWYPGRFDIWGSSHQIFHVLVVLAAIAHFVGLVKAFDYEHSYRKMIMDSYDRARSFGEFALY